MPCSGDLRRLCIRSDWVIFSRNWEPSLRWVWRGPSWYVTLGYPMTSIPSRFASPISFFVLNHCLTEKSELTNVQSIQLSSEWWAWEACALAASLLGPVSLAAQSVLLSTCSTFYQIPASLGIASAVRVGNLLGAGRGWEAKWASRASLILSIVFAALNRWVSCSL